MRAREKVGDIICALVGRGDKREYMLGLFSVIRWGIYGGEVWSAVGAGMVIIRRGGKRE